MFFAKYAGCGNDFILFDNRSRLFDPANPNGIVQLCHRRDGIGADGVITLEASESADFRMRIFNSDGSEPEMCGNGIRCLARFIHDLGIEKHSFVIETMLQPMRVTVENDLVSVFLPLPTNKKLYQTLTLENQEIVYHYIETGNPHAVVFVDNLNDDALMKIAPMIRYHQQFAPKGTNVHFAKVISKSTLELRSYERGLEQESMACGTGATASALIAADAYQLTSPVTVITRLKEGLKISFSEIANEVVLTGPAVKIFQGKISLNNLGFRLN